MKPLTAKLLAETARLMQEPVARLPYQPVNWDCRTGDRLLLTKAPADWAAVTVLDTWPHGVTLRFPDGEEGGYTYRWLQLHGAVYDNERRP